MASMQCCKPANESCQSKSHGNSLGHKLSEIAGKIFKGNHHGDHASAHCQTDGHHTGAKAHGHGLHIGQHSSHDVACEGEKKKKNKGEHKKKERNHHNKRRDGNGSCSDGGSSSDSD
ncbi:hypothetical protein L6164_018035 [Bauhinia variegata]|uniref:Uncharacterized protein n=1 Tax=Bauhinia variegata TaxID=167791 RepID=A0ACB9NB90_BAUVA|nr:hypothetical protein L6164_018035 [Bauhinia variegata]